MGTIAQVEYLLAYFLATPGDVCEVHIVKKNTLLGV